MNIIRRIIIVSVSLLLFLGISTARSNAQGVSFASATNYTAGKQAHSVAVGDFNHDGIPDLAVANYGSNNVSILLGNADGTFRTAVNYAAGTNPMAVAIGDFNGDGKLDLAVANYGSNNVSVLLGNGDGTFQPAVNFAAVSTPESVAVGDFNRDGKPDLAVANAGGVSVLLNTTTAAATAPDFAQQQTFTAGNDPQSVAVGDFNHDGKPDLVVANNGSSNVSVLLNTAVRGATTPSFASAQNFAAGTSPKSVAVGDFNRDGKVDLAVTDAGGGISILLNTTAQGAATASFTAQSFATGLTPTSIAVGDFNRDGRLDLSVTNSSGGVSVLEGNGNGTFQTALSFAAGLVSKSVVAGDFNRDGRLDLAMASESAGASILLNTTPPAPTRTTVKSSLNPAPTGSAVTFTATVTAVSGTPTGTVQFMDGATALGSPITLSAGQATYTTNALAAGVHSIHAAYSGDASFAASDSAPSPVAAGLRPVSIATADLNGDGIPDVVDADPNTNSIYVLLGNANGTFQPAVSYTLGAGPYSVAIGDFNGDGIPDLAVANQVSNYVSVLLGNGNGTFQKAVSYAAGSLPMSVAVGDFNGDGIPDLAVANNASSNVSILLGNGDGTFQKAVNYAVGGYPWSVAVADLNRDGIPDLAVVNASSNNFSILLGNGDGTFQAAENYPAGGMPFFFAVGDFNGDGIPDLAVSNNGSNSVSILLGNGDGTFQNAMNYAVASAPGYIVTSDFNRDGKLDLAVESGLASYIGILLGNGDGTFQNVVNYPVTGLRPAAVADFNRDGIPDLAVATMSGVRILFGNGKGSFNQTLSENVGVLPTASLSAVPPFNTTIVGQTGNEQTVTLNNTGTAQLNISAVAISGDFSISGNGCIISLSPGQSCAAYVTFKPTGGGTRTGAITFTDNAANSPQSGKLTGVGQDFTLAARTTSMTVSPGITATYDLVLSPEGDYYHTVNLSCSGAPAHSTCTMLPSSPSLKGTSDTAVQLKVSTTGGAMVVPGGPGNFMPPPGSLSLVACLAIIGLLGLIVLARLSPKGGRVRRAAPWATLALLAALCAGCGGGTSTTTTTSSSNSTPAGTYTLTVTGTSGSLTQTTQVTLTVK